jgi:hypothetical protein
LKQKGAYDKTCEVCSAKSWSLQPFVMTAMSLNRGTGRHFFGITLPSLPFVCNNCGNTKTFNVYALGLRKLSEESDG